MVAFLAHEDCPVSGEIYTAGGGRFARLFIASTAGLRGRSRHAPRSRTSPQHWAAINDETGYSVPADLIDWSKRFLAHLRPTPDVEQSGCRADVPSSRAGGCRSGARLPDSAATLAERSTSAMIDGAGPAAT